MLINITKINLNPNVGGGGKPIELENKEITITENGTTVVVPSDGFGGLSSVDITTDVPTHQIEANKSISITENGSYSVTPSDGYVGVGDVDISVFVSEVGTSIDFSEIGYNATANQNANMAIQDGIEYAKQIQAEYTDSKKYNSNGRLVYFPMVDTSNRTSCSGLFYGCGGLQYVPPLTISDNCTTMYQMFYECRALSYLDVSNFNTSNVTSLSNMFRDCNSLSNIDVSNWNTSNVTNMSGLFYGCNLLKTIDLSNWNTSNVTDVVGMFRGCNSLSNIDVSNWNVSNLTKLDYTFYSCSSLTTLDLSSWNVRNITSYNYTFSSCTSLTNFIAPQNINASISFGSSSNLTVDSMLNILNNLTDRTATTSMTCTLGHFSLNKLTDEQKAIATSKNWVLA